MTILWAAGEMDGFSPSGPSAGETAANYDSAFARGSILLDGSTSVPDAVWIDSEDWANQTGEFWLHFEHAQGTVGGASHTALALLNGSGTEVFRIRQSFVGASTLSWQMQYRNGGGTYTNAGSAAQFQASLGTYDFRINVGADLMELYAAGTLQADMSGTDLSHISGVTQARFYSEAQGRDWSQCVAADESTVGGKLGTWYPSGNGAETAWTGTYADIDELAFNDGDFIYTSAANDVETVTTTGPSITGYRPRAVIVSPRSKRGATGPQNQQAALRVSGTTYFSSTKALATGLGPRQGIWMTNPAGGDWAAADIAALQPGVKAIA